MRKKPLLIVLALLFAFVKPLFSQSPTDIFISEYVEGSSNNKALEFYNGSTSSINLTTGNYVIQMYFNGSNTAATTISLAGTIAPNGVFVLANSLASFATAAYVNQTNSSSWYNGDDAIVLRKGGASGTIVDVIGQVGFDPGAEWGTGLVSTADNTIRRKANVCTGDITSTDIFDPSLQWDGFATDDFSGLGAHSTSCTMLPGITINSAPLSFTTNVGAVSAEQSYTIKGNSLTQPVSVTVPALSNFGLSLVAGGPYTSNVSIPAASANAAPVTIYVIFSPTSSGVQSGNISHVSDTYSANLSVQGTGATAGEITKIYSIQGAGDATPFLGMTVTTEGVVTADFQGTNQLGGFYIQDTTGDGNNLSSDGVFIFNTSFNVNVGDYVRLSGTADEFFNKTEIKDLTSLSVLATNVARPASIAILLPVTAIADLERNEGMLVSFPQNLTVTETFTLGRFGEVALSANGRRFNPTNFVDLNDVPASGTHSTGTSNLPAVIAQQDLNDRSRILLDDASSVQNPAIVPYLNPADTTLRSGSTLLNLTGVLDYDFSVYRVQPTATPTFVYAPRPSVPVVGNSNLKIASFNVLNYFNGNGTGGGFPTSRGANTAVEFTRQRTKIINAIKMLDADVLGLMEMENDGDGVNSAIANLVSGLNEATAPGTYSYISDPVGANGNTGTDEIKVALIYKPGKLTASGPSRADVNPVHNRPPLAQTFMVNSNNEKFTMIVNHFKSKSCTGASGANADQLDGQGCYTDARRQQATALLSFIANIQSLSADSDIISVGDYNSYEEEDPLDILRAGGLVNSTAGIYSYVFDGQTGSLDYAFTTPGLVSKITGVDKWHINADEPIFKDYNQEFNPAYAYSPGPYRSSDHDPALVGFRLGNAAPTVNITSPTNNSSFSPANSVLLAATANDIDGTIAKVDFSNNGIRFLTDSTAPYSFAGSELEPGTYLVTATAFDNAGDSTISDTVHVTITGCAAVGYIRAEGYTNIPGTQVSDLTSNAAYPKNATISAQLEGFEYSSVGDNYGGRLRGYICPPLTGNYTFYIAGDDQAGLFLSTDSDSSHKSLVAYNLTPVGFRDWFHFSTQRSVSIRLVKGAKYYIETLHKQSTGANHLSVGWILPNGVYELPISKARLSPYEDQFSGKPSAITQQFVAAMLSVQQTNKPIAGELSVNATPSPFTNQLTLVTESASQELLTIQVTDISGRIVKKLSNVAANGKTIIGPGLHASGLYIIEVIQGKVRKRVKVVKQ